MLLLFREIKRNLPSAFPANARMRFSAAIRGTHREEILFEETFPWSRSVDLRLQVLQPGVLSGDAEDWVHAQYQATVDDTEKLPGESRRDARMREMFRLNTDWFMQTLLTRKDRMSMYWGLEMRVPFCDHRLVEYAYNMPWAYKNLHGREKGVLREAFQDLLPARITWRKKKPVPAHVQPCLFCARVRAFLARDGGKPVKRPFKSAVPQSAAAGPGFLGGAVVRPAHARGRRFSRIFCRCIGFWWITTLRLQIDAAARPW